MFSICILIFFIYFIIMKSFDGLEPDRGVIVNFMYIYFYYFNFSSRILNRIWSQVCRILYFTIFLLRVRLFTLIYMDSLKIWSWKAIFINTCGNLTNLWNFQQNSVLNYFSRGRVMSWYDSFRGNMVLKKILFIDIVKDCSFSKVLGRQRIKPFSGRLINETDLVLLSII